MVARVIKLELDQDQVEQLTRLIDMAKMMDGPEEERFRKYESYKEPFDIIAYRAFLQEILDLLRKALEQ